MNIKNLPKHVAIILDGNGRWAKRLHLPRSTGHYQGGFNVARIANHASKRGIEELTIYAFSTENWKRPKDEVDYLMTKPIEVVHANKEKIFEANIRIQFKGRRDRFSKELLALMEELESTTKVFDGMILNVCVDYGSYDEIVTAFKNLETLDEKSVCQKLMIPRPVDFLIRTGGEQRLSNFLLWQAAYAELYFTKKYWPAFKERHFDKALKEFSKRHRRFGGL
ncbi:MAG: polyprenyl diphosphate synthase [Acholeplasma sp.]